MGQRPVAPGESTKHLTVRVNESLLGDLDDFTDRTGSKKADVVRAALRQYLDQEVSAA